MARRFTRRRENFTCENCNQTTVGDGYTNHCPHCLHSKHVDNNPGDRENQCSGLMKPIAIEVKADHYIIIHHCLKCGAEKRNKSASDDSFDAILGIMKSQNLERW